MERPLDFPPSFTQQLLWARYEMSLESRPNLEVPIWIDGTFDTRVLREALRDVVSRHEILRTAMKDRGGSVVQHVDSFEDVKELIDITIESAFTDLTVAAKHRFNLRSELPIRFHLGAYNRARQLLLVVAHPAAMDAWSVQPFLQDLHIAYTARLVGRMPAFDELPFQYADYSLQQQRWSTTEDGAAAVARRRRYWTATLEAPPARIDLPVDRRVSHSYEAAALPMRINPALHQRCVDVAHNTGAGVLAVLQAGLITAASTYTAGREVSIATIVDGRSLVALRSLVGPFANPIVLRVDISGNPTFCDLVNSTHNVYLTACANEISSDALLGLIPALASSWARIAQIMLAFRTGTRDRVIRLPDAQLTCKSPRACAGHQPELFFDLVEYRAPDGAVSGLDGVVWYDAARCDRTTIEKLTCRFVDLLARAVVNPHVRLADLVVANDGRDDGGRPHGLQVYVRPGNPTQARLVGLWERLVGLHRIGVKDVLVDVGGHHALFIRFADEIAAWCGERLPISMFTGRTTVASLGDELVRRLPRELLAHAQIGDADLRRPLFLLHGDVGGGGYYTIDLLRALGPKQPVYTLHPHGVTTRGIPASIEEMAEEYITCIRQVQPRGPYHLGGYCNAGLVAYEIARRLSQAGHEVSSLVLIGTALNRQTVPTSTRTGSVRPEPARRGEAGLSTGGNHATVAERYRPESYAGTISLLWPTEERGYGPPDLGWRSVCDRVELTYVPGSRDTCVTEHIGELAVELNRCLTAHRATCEHAVE